MLNRKTRYLQIALNSALDDAREIIRELPASDRIIIEAGTPLIKRYGTRAIAQLSDWWGDQLRMSSLPYIAADMKTMDRGETEVVLAKQAGASAIIALGQAPIETVNAFISACQKHNIDSMLDMMNVDQPIKVMRRLKALPTVVILHRGVDEETYNRSIPIPYHQINKEIIMFHKSG